MMMINARPSRIECHPHYPRDIPPLVSASSNSERQAVIISIYVSNPASQNPQPGVNPAQGSAV